MPVQTGNDRSLSTRRFLECDLRDLLFQGAEARVYRSTFLGKPCAVKERFHKKYRAPILDAELARSRLLQEARALNRCRRAGVDCPVVYFVDVPRRRLFLELVDHLSLRNVLDLIDSVVSLGCPESTVGFEAETSALRSERASLVRSESIDRLVPHWLRDRAVALFEWLFATPGSLKSFIEAIAVETGKAIAKLHNNRIIHGDLTTSNLIIRSLVELRRSAVGLTQRTESREDASAEPPLSVVFIDFGLSSTSPSSEAMAVELYVMERAILSSHPNWKNLMNDILVKGYYPFVTNAIAIAQSLKEVRLRGRKRLAIG